LGSGARRPLNERRITLDDQIRREARKLRLLNPKSTTKIGTWNVRSMYISGKTHIITNEMKTYETRTVSNLTE
jgi:hypothetical protein